MVGELLPHEFEELLAKLLSVSKKTLIVNLVNADKTMVCSEIAFLNQCWIFYFKKPSQFERQIQHVFTNIFFPVELL